MGDLETRLDEALAGTAARAPHPTDLAAGARSTLRRRRRTTAAVVAAAAVVVAIPVTVSVVSGSGTGGAPDRDDSTVADSLPADWRTETWHDLSVTVPPDWTYGGGSDWCTSGRGVEATTPQVSRPAGVIPTIACSPSYGYGAHFGEPSSGELPPGTEGVVQQYRGSRYPDGSWIGYASTGAAAVWVVTDDRTTTRQVLDSATPVGEVDANGCATRLEMSAPSGSDRLSVCRYDRRGWLEQSELLSPADSASARGAVAEAPGAACTPDTVGGTVVTLHASGFGYRLVLGGSCAGVTDDAGTTKQATRDVLYWALSPGWSGGLSFLTYDEPTEPLELRRP